MLWKIEIQKDIIYHRLLFTFFFLVFGEWYLSPDSPSICANLANF